MNELGGFVKLVLLATAGVIGCSRADLYPVTRDPTLDAGAEDAGGADGSTIDSESADSDGSDDGGSDGGGIPNTCPELAMQPGDSSQTVLVNGMMRSYVLHIPPGYDGLTPVPLVVDFHGVGGSGMSQLSNSPYPSELDPDGVVMAFPDGLAGPAGTAWNVGPCCVADVDDVAYTRALVAHVRATACIDARRVYAVGVLTGGGMAHYLACHAADLFAAVAPAAFDLLAENVEGCVPERPVTVISFRGNQATRVPYEGGPSSLVPGMPLTFLGAEGTFEAWSAINGCVGAASTPDADGCSAYQDCDDGVEVVLCTKAGASEEHGDPGVAWPVLSRHVR